MLMTRAEKRYKRLGPRQAADMRGADFLCHAFLPLPVLTDLGTSLPQIHSSRALPAFRSSSLIAPHASREYG
jgi:hypothetical protein